MLKHHCEHSLVRGAKAISVAIGWSRPATYRLLNQDPNFPASKKRGQWGGCKRCMVRYLAGDWPETKPADDDNLDEVPRHKRKP